ncbi:MAG TPA: ATP-dependent DNA ligase [Polyangiaceae bacterium]|nr:ATP-dependent DNA ligase [Polyangiaceae bacterium]
MATDALSPTLLERVVDASEKVAGTRSRSAKIALLGELLRSLVGGEVALAVAYLTGELPQGRIGLGYAAVFGADAAPAAVATLTLHELDARLEEIARLGGSGAGRRRHELLGALLAHATEREQAFVKRLLVGELRQGALEGVMADAVGKAFGVEPELVRRAAMLAGDLPVVAAAARAAGAAGLADFRLELFRPLGPMLAQTAAGPGEALERLGDAILEYKLDGARVQVHKAGDDVKVYTRSLHDVTARAPEVVEVVRALPVGAAILDGEVVSLRADGRPRSFQDTMSRFGKKLDDAERRAAPPLRPFFFDVLHADGTDYIDRPARERRDALRALVDERLGIPSIVTASADEAAEFLGRSLAAGHEGVMAKSLEAPYEAGRRGAGWLKVKPAHTLDLVVLAVEWGSGRRRGLLSNIHLGARDPAGGGFVMLGKTFKGMTDELLAWQTARFLELEAGRDGHVVHVRPEVVVEIAFDGVQRSSQYPGGVALRFARVRRYRTDKRADEADTIETVRRLADLG